MMKDYLRETPCIPGRESFLLGTRNGVGAVNRIDKAENLGRLFVLVPRRARFESQFSRQIALATNFYCHRRDISAGFPRQPEKRTGREGRGDFLKRNAPSGGQVVTRRIPESLLNV